MITNTTSTWLVIPPPTPEPTKKQIIERLFLQGLITFNEMWTLLSADDREIQYVPMPQPQPQPQPHFPLETPWTNPYPYPDWYTTGACITVNPLDSNQPSSCTSDPDSNAYNNS